MNNELDNYLHDINTQLDHVKEYLKIISNGIFVLVTIAIITIWHFW